jgi:hypothetical protein
MFLGLPEPGPKSYPVPNPDPLVRDTDLRIRTEMSRIRNTGAFTLTYDILRGFKLKGKNTVLRIKIMLDPFFCLSDPNLNPLIVFIDPNPIPDLNISVPVSYQMETIKYLNIFGDMANRYPPTVRYRARHMCDCAVEQIS